MKMNRALLVAASAWVGLIASHSPVFAGPEETAGGIVAAAGSSVALAQLCERPGVEKAARRLVSEVVEGRQIEREVVDLMFALAIERYTPSAEYLAERPVSEICNENTEYSQVAELVCLHEAVKNPDISCDY